MAINGPIFRKMLVTHGLDFEQQLRILFNKEMTCRDIAKHFNVSEDTMYYWLTKLGLTRSQSEVNRIGWKKGKWDRKATSQRAYQTGFNHAWRGQPCPWKGKTLPQEWKDNISKAQTGKKTMNENSNWKGGTSIKNYSKGWKRAKRLALQRANGKCQKCKSPFKQLDVHHKVPVKMFSDLQEAHHPDNLLVLCRACHKKLEVAMWTLTLC